VVCAEQENQPPIEPQTSRLRPANQSPATDIARINNYRSDPRSHRSRFSTAQLACQKIENPSGLRQKKARTHSSGLLEQSP